MTFTGKTEGNCRHLTAWHWTLTVTTGGRLEISHGMTLTVTTGGRLEISHGMTLTVTTEVWHSWDNWGKLEVPKGITLTVTTEVWHWRCQLRYDTDGVNWCMTLTVTTEAWHSWQLRETGDDRVNIKTNQFSRTIKKQKQKCSEREKGKEEKEDGELTLRH